jgi:hypothetical protein
MPAHTAYAVLSGSTLMGKPMSQTLSYR